MISNTNSSDLELANKIVFLPGGFQQKIQYNISTSNNINCNNNNNNNSIEYITSTTVPGTIQSQSTKPFIFYTAGGSHDDTLQTDDKGPEKESLPPTRSVIFLEQVEFSPAQANNLTQKIMSNLSALNQDRKVVDVSVEDKIASDTSNSSTSSRSNNKGDRQESNMCRTEDRENALFQIEDVHNYSKLNRYGYCNGVTGTMCRSGSSNQDDDIENEEDDEENDVEDEEDVDDDVGDDDIDYEQCVRNYNKRLRVIGDEVQQHHQDTGVDLEVQSVKEKAEADRSESPPDHHARRPMNAFLIFCKRHRSIVKAKYKNFENRSITKILGEWWASLDAEDKKCYVELANQNKKAFFSANPNFKWYKLPAPSLRTLNTRPGNLERPYHNSGDYQCEAIESPIQNAQHHHTTSSYNRNESKKVPVFKLADETQMGDLNSLMQPNNKTSAGGESLQEALGDIRAYLKNGLKRDSNGSLDESFSVKRLHSDNSFSSSEDDHIPKKTARSCKGKKYQELMNSGQIAPVIAKKQPLSKPPTSRSIAINGSPVTYNGHCNRNQQFKDDSISPKKEETPSKLTNRHYQIPDSPDSSAAHSLRQQQYNCVSFDLEDKIRALPAQCLESYLQRKKCTKRKKKINAKKRPTTQIKPSSTADPVVKDQEKPPPSHQQAKTAQEVKEQIVGSQKRKARKESITRRDISAIQNDVTVLVSGGAVITNSCITTPSSHHLIDGNDSATSDLHILAEVATKHMGIAQ